MAFYMFNRNDCVVSNLKLFFHTERAVKIQNCLVLSLFFIKARITAINIWKDFDIHITSADQMESVVVDSEPNQNLKTLLFYLLLKKLK